MALDGAFLYAVRQELSGLIGSRIEKIHLPPIFRTAISDSPFFKIRFYSY